jgi:hypothetical protein
MQKFIKFDLSNNKIIINNNKIKYLTFNNTEEIKLNGDIIISSNTIINKFEVLGIIHKQGNFDFENNTLEKKEETSHSNSSSFMNSSFKNFHFHDNNIKASLLFYKISLPKSQVHDMFFNCVFNSILFTYVDFGSKTIFMQCTFNESVFFIKCGNIYQSIFSLPESTFKKKVEFSESEFNSIKLVNTVFEDSVSFENVSCKTIKIDQTVFEKATFFDDFKVLNPESCSRKSLRIVKQQLQKADNRIDYNRFKIYELDAFKRELHNKEWKDKFILWLNDISSKHGTDWFQGIKFTVIIGFLFYSLYFSLYFYDYDFEFSGESVNRFFTGYFKYLIPSYKSPFGDSALSNVFQIITFILGKIFIGYGIYQTIQSFRKFRL